MYIRQQLRPRSRGGRYSFEACGPSANIEGVDNYSWPIEEQYSERVEVEQTLSLIVVGVINFRLAQGIKIKLVFRLDDAHKKHNDFCYFIQPLMVPGHTYSGYWVAHCTLLSLNKLRDGRTIEFS